ncbi:MAG: selenocysteine-specific elongation factor [Verrucomicrobiales bacterium]|jgi:selenocysteine-specific elongation factor
MSHVVSTAGHVDHGKSTLVRVLTGTDPDRFAEEKERGLTIDLGFASTKLPSGKVLSLVDVPGHIRFLKNMLAGVGAVDACLFVVDANEGWKPQTEEHLRILDLLGVRHGVIALTKIGLADEDLIELAILDVEDRVEGTFLEGAPIVPVDSLVGTGIDALRVALDELLAATPDALDRGTPRLWVDRAFSAKGSGTVVTGTLTGGRIRVDDELLLLPQRETVRVRALQSLHAQRTKVGPGNRTAINLSGVSHDQIRRGDALVRSGEWHETSVFDGALTVLDSLDHDVSRRGAHLLYLGAGEHAVRIRILGAAITPGATGNIRIYLPDALPLLPGDRFVLRESGRAETIGGGEVLDVDPRTKASEASPDRSVDRVVAERGWVASDELALLTGERRDPDVGRWVVDPAALQSAIDALRAQVDTAGALGLDTASLDEQQRATLELLSDVVVNGGRATQASAADPLLAHPYVLALRAGGFTPPDSDGVDREELRELVRRGEIIVEDGVYFAPEVIDDAARLLFELLAQQPEGVTVSEVRQAMGNTRKHAMPLIARLDAGGITRRRENLRIAGPRLPTN